MMPTTTAGTTSWAACFPMLWGWEQLGGWTVFWRYNLTAVSLGRLMVREGSRMENLLPSDQGCHCAGDGSITLTALMVAASLDLNILLVMLTLFGGRMQPLHRAPR